MRTRLRTVATLGFAAFWSCAAEGADVTGPAPNFTFTDFVTRVPITAPWAAAVGIPGPNFVCHAVAARPGRFDAENFRLSLFRNVVGKSADDLGNLLVAVRRASGPEAKVRALFGIDTLVDPGPTTVYRYYPTGAQIESLQMGQEVTLGPTEASANHTCYTIQQIDQAIAEGTRVVAAIIQALQPAKPLVQPQVTEERGAPKK